MPPSKDPNVPQEPKSLNPEIIGSGAPHPGPDISKILLPKKETGPTPESAQRINAGALLAQEESATLTPAAKPELHQENGLVEAKPTRGPFLGEVPTQSAPSPAAAPAATPKEERPEVSPLQTYKGDVERSVEDRGVSVVSVAAAEAVRRGKESLNPEEQKEKADVFSKNLILIAGGTLFILLALGVAAFIFLRPTTVPGPQTPHAPFLSVDDTVLVVADTSSRDTLVTNIAAAVQSARLSLGLIEWLYVAPAGVGGAVPVEVSIQTLMGTLAPDMPEALVRTLQPTYLLGVHSFDQNQAFLLLQTDSYETAYSGMLAWERTMRADLYPIFMRAPSPRLNTQAPAGTSTQTVPSTQFFDTGFVDKVVENRDARVILNEQGDILLLWTMLGRNIILITTNEYTLREVISRMNIAPIVPIPTQ